MTTLVVGNIKSTTTSPPVIRNSSNTEVGWVARAWVNFDGSNLAIRASGNVSSITDEGTGSFTVNLTNAMPDANYAVCASGGSSGNVGGFYEAYPHVGTASAVRVVTGWQGSYVDLAFTTVAIFR